METTSHPGGSKWQRKKRILIRIVLGLMLLCGLVVGSFPLWFPWLLRPLARRVGVTYDSYQTTGYGRCLLSNVHAQFGVTRINVQRLELLSPNLWLWHYFVGGTGAKPYAQADHWLVEFLPEIAAGTAGDDSTGAILDDVDAVAAALRRYLPSARLRDGVLRIGLREIILPEANWQSTVLTTTAQTAGLDQILSLRAQFATPGRTALHLVLSPWNAQADLALTRKTNWNVAGEILWRSNQVAVTSQIGYRGWWPERTRLTLDLLELPAGSFQIEGYQAVGGSIAVDAQTNRFTLQAQLDALPEKPGNSSRPPLKLTAVAHGDPKSITLDTLLLTTAYAQSALAAPVGFDWGSPAPSTPAKLSLKVDLSQLSVPRLSGQINGILQLQPQNGQAPAAQWELRGSGVALGDLAANQLLITGGLTWPLLVLDHAEIEFSDHSAISAGVALDLATQTLTNGHWRFAGGLARQWLPVNVGYSNLVSTGQFNGPLRQPRHAGGLTLTGLTAPGVRKCDAHLGWRGQALNLSAAEVTLSTAEAQLQIAAALRAQLNGGVRFDATLQKLDWQRGGQTVYQLEQPSQITLIRSRDQTGVSAWQIAVQTLRWVAKDREVKVAGTLAWPRSGDVQLVARKFQIDEFRPLFDLPRIELALDVVDFKSRWTNGPVDWQLELNTRWSDPGQKALSVTAKLAGGAKGFDLRPLTIDAAPLPAVSIVGHVPILAEPTERSMRLRLDAAIPFDLSATNLPSGPLSQSAGKLGEFSLTHPEFQLRLAGLAAELKGALGFQASAIDWTASTNRLRPPRIEQFKMAARLEAGAIRLETLSGQLAGQPIRATGTLPLPANFWANLISEGTLPDWTRFQGQLEVQDAELAPLADRLPGKWITEGRLNIDARLEAGPKLQGRLRVAHAATRPIGGLGSLRDVNLALNLHERTCTLESLTALVAGAPVTVTGALNFNDRFEPEFNCHLRGTNVPLARNLETIIRSDLDLHLASVTNGPPVLSGQVLLRDSLYLEDLQLLIPGPEAQPSQRPPYFNVPQAPFRDWKLNVNISGNRFLRVRTTLFTGRVSANFRLQNTLADPIAIGEASLQASQITFPFGTLHVNTGFIYLSNEAPHRPRLLINASGDCYGYTIQVEISGPADTPKAVFSSTPPLTSGQIMLLLTSGQLPQNAGAFTRTARAERLALFLGKDALSRVMGSEGAQERLKLTSGEHISASGKATYSVEYRLSERWSLVGEYDQFDSLNAHFKWKVYAK